MNLYFKLFWQTFSIEVFAKIVNGSKSKIVNGYKSLTIFGKKASTCKHCACNCFNSLLVNWFSRWIFSFSGIKHSNLFKYAYLFQVQLVSTCLQLSMRSNAEITLYKLWSNLMQHLNNCWIDVALRCFNVVLAWNTSLVPTLFNVENPAIQIFPYLTPGQCSFNVNPQHWNNVDLRLMCCLGAMCKFMFTKVC